MITSDALSAAERTRVEALLEECTAHDGVAALDEAARLALTGPGARHLLLPSDDETAILGYASLLPDGTVQGMVHPGARRRGLGSHLLQAVLELRPDAGVWAHGALDEALAFLASHGLRVTRRLLTLQRDLGSGSAEGQDAPSAPLPPVPPARIEGLELDFFDADRDAQAWLELNAQAFADHPEQGSLTRADLERRLRENWFDPEDFLLARRGGDLLGFVWMKREHADGRDDAAPAVAEIYVVGTAPEAQGRGVAGHLLGTALHRLQDTGADRVELYVEADNTAALELYRRWGFDLAHEDAQLRLPEAG